MGAREGHESTIGGCVWLVCVQIWTGDISVSWDALRQTPQYLLNWGLSGVAYLTCDIGGFNGGDTPADLLVRWYQVGSVLGMFRVHSKLGNNPHFPFLYDAASATNMQHAMVCAQAGPFFLFFFFSFFFLSFFFICIFCVFFLSSSFPCSWAVFVRDVCHNGS
jgi:hypothetical protein